MMGERHPPYLNLLTSRSSCIAQTADRLHKYTGSFGRIHHLCLSGIMSSTQVVWGRIYVLTVQLVYCGYMKQYERCMAVPRRGSLTSAADESSAISRPLVSCIPKNRPRVFFISSAAFAEGKRANRPMLHIRPPADEIACGTSLF